MQKERFRTMAPSSIKILLMLGCQYRGNNNGDLSAPFSLAQQWGIGSKTTLAKGLRALEAAELIIRTRDSQFQMSGAKCCLYALSWHEIDHCDGKLDVSPTTTPRDPFETFESSPFFMRCQVSFCTRPESIPPKAATNRCHRYRNWTDRQQHPYQKMDSFLYLPSLQLIFMPTDNMKSN